VKTCLSVQMLVVAGLLGSLLLTPCAVRGQEPLQPGQLARVAVGLQENGKAWSEQGLNWLLKRESVGHLIFMATDPRGGTGGGGWYKPSQSRYDWNWLQSHFDKDGDGEISLKEFSGRPEWFEALDKNRDGLLTKEDFEWFGDSALSKAGTKAKALFAQIDQDSNGQVTPAEWKKWFDNLSGKKGYIAQDDLLPLFMEKRMPTPARTAKITTMLDRLTILCSYVSGDVGSLSEGPSIGETARYFTLTTSDGLGKLDLSKHRGQKPLVLIFGSFT
jgi:hypothetical protein